MIVFSFKNAGLSFGDITILDDITFSVNEKERIGIVGNNGAGKTSLIKLITGEYLVPSGECFVHSRIKSEIGYLPQNSGLDSELTVLEEFMLPFRELSEMKDEIDRLESRLESKEADPEKISQRLSTLYFDFKRKGGLEYENRVRSVLRGMGFDESSYGLKISSLSGGQKTRLALGRILLKRPEVMILDEPTNHLDIESVEWLESELKDYSGTLLVISHDRAFLDAVSEKTLLVENGGAYLYNAPYSKYTELRNADIQYQERCYKQQQKEIARIQAFIENQRKWNRERNIIAAESRIKYLDRMVIVDKPRSPEDPPAVAFDVEGQVSKDILSVKGLSFTYPGRTLFENLNFEIHGHERVFITGPNGCGKSTFLKIITDSIPDNEKKYISGSFRIGSTTRFSYYAQDLSGINGDNTVFDEIYEYANKDRSSLNLIPVPKIRSALASFGFHGDDVFKTVNLLSGGEKSRLQLLKISYDHSQLLILDEPTNHLDISTREELEKALLLYEGTMIVVSHDRYFCNKLATKFIDISSFSPENTDEPEVKEISQAAKDYNADKEKRAKIRKAENDIKKATQALSELEQKAILLEAEIEKANSQSDFVALSKLCQEKDETEAEMLDKMEKIEELSLFLKSV